jgi:hypothetical protein
MIYGGKMAITWPAALMPIPWSNLLALSLSILALYVAVKSFRRKSGLLVKGGFGISSSASCDDRYVHRITLTNMKDRSVTIFAIYLRVSHNYYIRLEEMEESPLILKAYETYSKEFGPIQFYSVNLRKVNLDHLLENKKVKKTLVLSTPEGKYVVPSFIKMWNPIGEFFTNHQTAVVVPSVLHHKGKTIGSRVKYVADFTFDDGSSSQVQILASDFQTGVFKHFTLSRESLISKQTLSDFLTARIADGKLKCKAFQIHEMDSYVASNYDLFSKGEKIKLPLLSFVQYHAGGRYLTWRSNREMNQKNQRTRIEYEQTMKLKKQKAAESTRDDLH